MLPGLPRYLYVQLGWLSGLRSTEVGQLGGTGGPVDDADGFADLFSLNDTTIIALPWKTTEASVWALDLHGRVKWRAGRKGSGPGEFERPYSISPLPADSIAVYDQALARVSIIDRNGKVGRSFRGPAGAVSFVSLGGTSGIAVGRFGRNASGGAMGALPMHAIKQDSVVRSFGELQRDIDPRDPFQFDRVLVPFRGGVVAVSRANQLVVEHWTREGKLVSRYVREPAWFPVAKRFVVGSTEEPPSPLVQDAWIDRDERLWLLITRAAPTWKDAFSAEPMRTEGGGARRRITRPELYYEGVVEVIDLRRGELVVSEKVPFQPSYAIGRGLIGVKQKTKDGDPFLSLLRMELINK